MKESTDIDLRMKAFDQFIRYGQWLTNDMYEFLNSENPEEYSEKVRNRFVNFSDEGSAIQDTLEEYGREEVLEHLEESQENGEYVREEFENFEGYIQAVTENIDEMMNAHEVPEEAREPIYEGLEIMIDHYDPRE